MSAPPDARLALTFDDGPDPVWTPAVRDELARLDVRATFFVVAPCAIARRELVRAVLDGGHAVELHCWTHERHSHRDRATVEDETDRSLEALARLGVTPALWRTPWGDEAAWTRQVAETRGLTVVGWTADTHDWRGDDATTMLAAIEGDLGAGGSVLMHDGLGPGARRTGCAETVRLLAPLCRAARARRLTPGPMNAPVPV